MPSVNGRCSAIVLHLLNRELAALEDCIKRQQSRRSVLAAEYNRSEEVQAFEEINRLIVKWVDCVPDWTPALAAFQQENLQLPNGRSHLPARRPRIPVRPSLPAHPGPQVPLLAPQQAAQVSRIVSRTMADLEAEVSSLKQGQLLLMELMQKSNLLLVQLLGRDLQQR
jgi:hypothetical protein